MDTGRRNFNPRSQGLYSSSSISLFVIYVSTSFVVSAVGCSGPNRVNRTTLIYLLTLSTMDRVASRDKPSGAISMAASARECAAPPPAMT